MIEDIIVSPDSAGKDAHPMDTVKQIKSILEAHHIKTEEYWGESDVPHCYSLRINIAGTAIGANGKGVNKEFALASGYGELMERLQLGLIWRNKVQVEGGASSCEAQSQVVKAAELYERNSAWYDALAKKLQESTGVSVTGRDVLKQYADADGNVQATPFYCVTTKTKEYLPTALCKDVYVSSGGAAGNTIEEAMVQSLSEIVERHHKLRIILEDLTVPEIPEEVLQTCEVAYEIISFLRSNGYKVIVKDCSLGMRFPAVCVCIIDINTGKYHTHFGANPSFQIALQRTLTECFQGRNIRNITQHVDFSDSKKWFDLRCLLVELLVGTSEKTPQFFFKGTEQSCCQTIGFEGTTNQEYLKECISYFKELGYDILVRDSSVLGFPTYQIIIPGYSEVLPQRILGQFNDNRYTMYAGKALRNPVAANHDDLFGLMMHLAQSSKLRVGGLENFTTESGIPATLSAVEEEYLMGLALAHVNYTLGRTKDAISYLGKAIQTNISENAEYLICFKRYLSMKQTGYSEEEIEKTLQQFHREETKEKLYSFLRTNENPLDPVVLRCDLQCAQTCPLYDNCKKKYVDELVQLIVNKAKSLDQSAMEKILQNI